jgi:O-methyltransferase
MLGSVKHVITDGLSRMGYQLHRVPRTGSSRYEPVAPLATYAPWSADTEFDSVFNAIKGNTLVDVYRCWELWSLLEQTAAQPGSILEVGVWRGGTGSLLATKAKLCDIADPVYLCDTFEGVVKAGENDSGYIGGEHSDTSEALVRDLVGSLGLNNVCILKGIFPDASAHLIPENAKFRFAHIDVDVYQSAKEVFHWVWPRMPAGGIVVFDDYGFFGCEGVASFVDQELRGQPGHVVLHNLNGHAVVVKTAA